MSAALAIGMLTTTRASFGGLVAPGETISTDGGSFVEPGGTVLLDAMRVVDILFPLEPETNPEITTVTVTFRSQVIRDPATQHLTFVYRLQETPDTLPNLLDEKIAMAIKSFAGFQTDVTSSVSLTIERSADGGTINAFTPPPGVDELELPTIVIATDATEFDSLGNIDGTINANIPVPPPGASNLSTPFSLPLTYQPIGSDGGGGGAIPLPGAVWTGMVMLGATGAIARWRKGILFGRSRSAS